MNAKELVKRLLYTRRDVDDWISGKAFPFAKYDSDLGYLHRNRRCRNGIDGSDTVYTYDRATWARRIVNHSGEPCRINTYGDSYTNCEQVNDGETWQEILAAHIGEPIRNFGTGGYSVYQAYLRMKREEMIVPAKYAIINIYDDDHYRNLVGWQRMRLPLDSLGSLHFQPPLPYVDANPARKSFREFKNPCPEPKDLYDLCDLDRTYERFKDDFFTRIILAKVNVERGTPADSYRDIEGLAEEYGVRTKEITSSKKLLEVANALAERSAIYATMCIVQKAEEFASERGKETLYVTSYSTSSIGNRLRPGHGNKVPEMRKPGMSFSQGFVSFMRKRAPRYVDLMEAHLRDFSKRNVSMAEYLAEYYASPTMFNSHYSPHGNYFTAFAVKSELVDMLDPKPPSYLGVNGLNAWNACVGLN